MYVPEPVPNLDPPSRLDPKHQHDRARDIRCTSLAGADGRGRWYAGPGDGWEEEDSRSA